MATFDEFRNQIKREGLQRLNRFTVFFPMPNGLGKSNYFSQLNLRKIMMFCSHAELPGLSLSTTEVRTTGEVRRVPYDRNFDPLFLDFYADTSMGVKYFFEEWINLVQDRSNRLFTFFEEYAVPQMVIHVEDIQNNKVYYVAATDVYPKAVSDVQMGHQTPGYMSIRVQFEYRFWESGRIENGVIKNYINPSSLALSPGEQFVSIQGSSLPGIGPKVGIGAATTFIQPSGYVLSGVIDGLQTDMGACTTGIAGLRQQIPANLFDQTNDDTITSLTNRGLGYNGQIANIGTILQSPAGSNISPVNLDGIYSDLNVTRAAVANVSGLVGAFTPNSVPGIASQLNSMSVQMDNVNTNIFATNTKVNQSIVQATNAINQLGLLVAPNTPRGQ